MLVAGNTDLEKEGKTYTLLSPSSSYKQTVFGCLTLKFFTQVAASTAIKNVCGELLMEVYG